jgi:hypothetical protein
MENGKCNGATTVKLPEIKFTKLFINGQFIDAASGSFLVFTSLLYSLISQFQTLTLTPKKDP